MVHDVTPGGVRTLKEGLLAAAVERRTLTLPSGFKAETHENALRRFVAEKFGADWEVDSIDPVAGVAYASRMAAMTEVTRATDVADAFMVRLARGTRPSDGDKVATKLEAQHEGYWMTLFEPFLGRATLTKLDDRTVRARGALSVALGVKPWDVQVTPTVDGGFDVVLPKTYVPSRHDDKLAEVAEGVIGAPGWFVAANPAKLTAHITPADPPTFPPVIPYPFNKSAKARTGGAVWQVPIGRVLGRDGKDGKELALDFDGTPGCLIVGTAGSGKSVTINALITGALERGYELAICDVPHKAIDFTWVEEFCRPGGFGCASPEATLTTLRMVYEEGERRARLLAQYGAQKIQELPDGVRPQPILVVLDEVTAMFGLEDVPKGIPKTHPLVQEALQKNLVVQMIKKYVAKIPAEMRFVGIRIVVATQMAQANTGISVPLKTNLANRMLLGANPNEAARGHAFLDPRSAPYVPENVKSDDKAARGVGVAEFEGQAPAVFKSYFAPYEKYREHLFALGVPTTDDARPSASQITRYTPSLDDEVDDGPPPSRLDAGGFGVDGRDVPEPRLRGAAAAAHELAVQEALFRKEQASRGLSG